ncbi:MAG: N-methyl-L-tryptophan oxidase [Chitinophagaceae bacterium]
MSYSRFDVIVAGTGSMGSAACYYLAARGCSVLGLEQNPTIPHELGSHTGQSRIIRKAYFEHPGYVPLLEKAYQNWRELEAKTGEQVYHKTGLLYTGPRQHPVIQGVKYAANQFNIEVNEVSEPGKYPAFNTNTDNVLMLETDAGFLLPEKAIRLYLEESVKLGVSIRTGEKLINWEKKDGALKVHTNRDTYLTSKLIITTGAWASQLSPNFQIPLTVTRQLVFWVEPPDPERYFPERFPCWMTAAEDLPGVWYGFPYLSGPDFPGPRGLKFAWHHAGEETDPEHVKREVSKEEIRALLKNAAGYFSPAVHPVVDVKTCLYTNTPDENFVIDRLPGYDGDLLIAWGFSGHGFKFASAVGEILAAMACGEDSGLPTGFLSLDRFG